MAIIPSTAKVLNQYENVNTTYGGSKAMKAQSKWYTMQDIEDTINASKPYKVFTALLTQSGEDDPNNEWSSGSGAVPVGITFEITGNDEGTADFTNIGSPNNEVGTFFVSTGGNPNNWGVSDNGTLGFNTGAPVATVLENTIGNIWFNYEDIGAYGCQSNDLFIDSKTFISITPTGSGGTVSIVVDNVFTSVKYISPLNNALNQIDNGLFNTPIEIRVYN